MNKTECVLAVILALLFNVDTNAQFYIAGDTTGQYVYDINYTISNGSAIIDIDCDHIPDLEFRSNVGGLHPSDWPRLSFFLTDAEVLNSGVGRVSLFYTGDTLYFHNNYWTANLGFIYGLGEAGPYGIHQIDSAYVAFRKIDMTGDTTYIYLNISTQGVLMTIHHVISVCAINPVLEINDINETPGSKKALVFPNPFSSQITFLVDYGMPTTVSLYNYLGESALQKTFVNSLTVSMGEMVPGIYFYVLCDKDGVFSTGKVVKQ